MASFIKRSFCFKEFAAIDADVFVLIVVIIFYLVNLSLAKR